jgi:hypothetical protein
VLVSGSTTLVSAVVGSEVPVLFVLPVGFGRLFSGPVLEAPVDGEEASLWLPVVADLAVAPAAARAVCEGALEAWVLDQGFSEVLSVRAVEVAGVWGLRVLVSTVLR